MSFRESIVRQFGQPRGLVGRLAGHIMAKRPSNIQRNRWMLELVKIGPEDRLLEIGYGPGLALAGALSKIETGLVVGIDHSTVMWRQASQRIAVAIQQGKARLLVGDIEARPKFDVCFDHIYAANVVMFWRDPVATFRYLRELLAPGGSVVMVFMPRNKGATSQDSFQKGREIEQWLRQAGFKNVRMQSKDFAGLAAVAVVADDG